MRQRIYKMPLSSFCVVELRLGMSSALNYVIYPGKLHWRKLIFFCHEYKLHIASWSWRSLCSPLRPGMPGLSLCRPCESCYSFCEFMWASILLCLKNTVSLEISIIFGFYHLSTSFSTFILEPRGINPWGIFLETFHSGLSKLIWAWIILCPEDTAPFWVICHLSLL